MNADDYRLPRSRLRPPLHVQRPPDKIAVTKHRTTGEWGITTYGLSSFWFATFEDAWAGVAQLLEWKEAGAPDDLVHRFALGAIRGQVRLS